MRSVRPDAAAHREAAMKRESITPAHWRPVAYVAVRDPETLEPVGSLHAGPVLVALFVRIGSTRLLDNRVIGRNTATITRAA